MTVSHVELYEALKGSVGEKAARLMAEIVPVAEDVVRRHDLAEAVSTVQREFAEVDKQFVLVHKQFAEVNKQFAEVNKQFAELHKQIGEYRVEAQALNTRTIRWILGVIVPLFAGTWGMMAALFLRAS